MTVTPSALAIISSLGPPRQSSTWSTTPANIIAALERAGVIVHDHHLPFGRARRVAYRTAGRLLGWGSTQPDRVGPWHGSLRRAASVVARREPAAIVLHFGSSHLPLIAPRARQRHYLVTDYNLHLLTTKGSLATDASSRYIDRVRRSERRIANELAGIFTISDYVRDDWLREYGLADDRVTTIGTGLGQPVMLEGHVKDYANGHLLYVGKHGFDFKGGELLLDAFDHALRARPDLKLVIIGNVADPKLAPHLPRIDANPAIEFHRSGTPDFTRLVRGAALYAAPAPAEPWGLIYLEAMMCETPVLGLNRNAMMQLTDNGRVGFVVDSADAKAVGDAIVAAMADPARLARMGRAGRAYVEATFTWDKVAERIIARLRDDMARETPATPERSR